MIFHLSSASIGFAFGVITTVAGKYLLGAFTGFSGNYLSDMFTDRRWNKEVVAEARRHFEDVAEQMPDLISALKARLEEDSLCREIYLTGKEQVAFRSSANSIRGGHVNMHNPLSKLKVLENNGYIKDSQGGDGHMPKYTLTEDFVLQLKQCKGSTKK